MPHAQTMLLLAFQACQSGGVLLASFLESSVVWKRYLQIYILAVGFYGTLINVCIIGVAMLMLTKGKARIDPCSEFLVVIRFASLIAM